MNNITLRITIRMYMCFVGVEHKISLNNQIKAHKSCFVTSSRRMSASKHITVTEIIDAMDNDEWQLSEDELGDDEFEDHPVLLPTFDYLAKSTK